MDVDDHAFLGGRLILREPKRGHRSGTDAVLLAAATRLTPGQHLTDVGAGAGAAALAALCRVENATATLIERDAEMAALARHNVRTNGLEERVEVVEVDIFDRSACQALVKQPADVVISNPPFYLRHEVRASIDTRRAGAHVLDGYGHEDWCGRLSTLATPRGRIVLVHRPAALPALLRGISAAAYRIRSVHPRSNKPATRILLEAYLGRRTPTIIEPPLVLHELTGEFTQSVDDLHRGNGWL